MPISKIAIVGNGLTRDMAPFGDKSFDIYTTGSVATVIPRVTEVFDIHREGRQSSDTLNGLGAWRVWLADDDASVDYGAMFPIDALVERFGNIFNCSMTMILGHAIMQRPDRIELYGIDFAEGYEPEFRVTFVYLLGLARGMGIDVYIAPGSLVFPEYRTYQYDAPDPVELALNRNLEGWRSDLKRATESAAYLRGALDAGETFKTMLTRGH